MVQNIPLLQPTNYSPATNILPPPPCKITSPATQVYVARFHGRKKTPISILSVLIFVCSNTSSTGQTDYSEMFYWILMKMLKQ